MHPILDSTIADAFAAIGTSIPVLAGVTPVATSTPLANVDVTNVACSSADPASPMHQCTSSGVTNLRARPVTATDEVTPIPKRKARKVGVTPSVRGTTRSGRTVRAPRTYVPEPTSLQVDLETLDTSLALIASLTPARRTWLNGPPRTQTEDEYDEYMAAYKEAQENVRELETLQLCGRAGREILKRARYRLGQLRQNGPPLRLNADGSTQPRLPPGTYRMSEYTRRQLQRTARCTRLRQAPTAPG